jgi:hypothetical protein
MSTNDADPPAITERKTSELCGDQVRDGIRCMRPRNHEGDHECYRSTGTPIRWK